MDKNPLEYLAKDYNFGLLTFLSFLGAKWEANNREGKSVYEKVSKRLQNYLCIDSFNQKNNTLVKWWILKVTDEHWLKLFRTAAEKGFENCLNILIENKSNVNVCSNEDGNTALHFATLHNLLEAGQKLISKNADVNVKNFDRKTTLHMAVENGNISYMQLLLEEKADINVRNLDGSTPLHLAAEYNKIDCLKLLIEKGAGVNEENHLKQRPLHLVFKRKCLTPEECTKALIDAGADINANANKDNNTALHCAVKSDLTDKDKTKCCEILIKAGADLSAKDSKGKTPLDFIFLKNLKRKRPKLFKINAASKCM
jgi:ankyrin repeat protein